MHHNSPIRLDYKIIELQIVTTLTPSKIQGFLFPKVEIEGIDSSIGLFLPISYDKLLWQFVILGYLTPKSIFC